MENRLARLATVIGVGIVLAAPLAARADTVLVGVQLSSGSGAFLRGELASAGGMPASMATKFEYTTARPTSLLMGATGQVPSLGLPSYTLARLTKPVEMMTLPLFSSYLKDEVLKQVVVDVYPGSNTAATAIASLPPTPLYRVVLQNAKIAGIDQFVEVDSAGIPRYLEKISFVYIGIIVVDMTNPTNSVTDPKAVGH